MTKKPLVIALLIAALVAPASLIAQDEAEGDPQGAFSGQLGAGYLLRGETAEALQDVGFAEDFRAILGLTLLGTDDPVSSLWYGFDFRFLLSYGSTNFYTSGDATDEVLFLDLPIRAAIGYNLGDFTVSGFAGPALNLIDVAVGQSATSGNGAAVASLFGVGVEAGVRAQYEWGPYVEIAYFAPNLIEIQGSPTLSNPPGLRVELGWYVYTLMSADIANAEPMEPGDM